MNIFSILGIAAVGTIMSILLKQYLPEYSVLATLATSIIILFWVVVNLIPVLDKLTYFIKEIKMPGEYSLIILKSLGIAFVVQLISDICKDAGETAIASKLELAGKISILILSLPLFEKIISIIFEMLS
ncbi:MAG: stage III sporulation protein AD [Oscillospiraceae bacterium]|nr:stage III sporulation protein AD [Oscillospiraceae bacterium]